MNTIATLFTPLRDRICIVNKKDAAPVKFRMYGLSDKIGTLKSGEKAPYVVLMKDDTATVINLHPEHAKRLMKNGSDSGITLTDEEYEAAEPTSGLLDDMIACKEEADNQAKVDDLIDPVVAAPIVDAAPVTVTAATLSKKQLTIILCKAHAGKARKDVIALLKSELNMSDAGASTYYQNVKSGTWV